MSLSFFSLGPSPLSSSSAHCNSKLNKAGRSYTAQALPYRFTLQFVACCLCCYSVYTNCQFKSAYMRFFIFILCSRYHIRFSLALFFSFSLFFPSWLPQQGILHSSANHSLCHTSSLTTSLHALTTWTANEICTDLFWFSLSTLLCPKPQPRVYLHRYMYYHRQAFPLSHCHSMCTSTLHCLYRFQLATTCTPTLLLPLSSRSISFLLISPTPPYTCCLFVLPLPASFHPTLIIIGVIDITHVTNIFLYIPLHSIRALHTSHKSYFLSQGIF